MDICDGKTQLSEDELPDLLGWLVDYNWPGAHSIARFLCDHAGAILPAVNSVLTTSPDMKWKYWLIVTLVLQWPRRHVAKLQPSLRAIAEGSDADEAHVVALEALAKNNLIDRGEARAMLERKLREFPQLKVDLLEVRQAMEQ